MIRADLSLFPVLYIRPLEPTASAADDRQGRWMPQTVLLIVLLFTACSAFESGSALTTDKRRYEPGDVVEIKLRNKSAGRLGSNLCFVQLEVKDGYSWRHVPHLAPNEACTSELRLMPPGASMNGQINLPRDLKSGSYRLRLDVEVGDDRRKVTSGSFRVQD